MKFYKLIRDVQVVTYCPENLAKQMDDLFNKLVELDIKGPQLRDGSIIRFGWSDLKLVKSDNELVIMEPDFNGNPLQNYLPQVTITLEVLTEQVALLKRLKLSGIAAHYRHKIIIAKNCLQKNNIYLERTNVDEEEKDSGWYIGELDDQQIGIEEDNMEFRYVFDIYKSRPALMKTLSLPPGYLIVFKGNEIDAVLNDKNENELV